MKVRAAGALMTVAALVAGVPAALLHVAGNPIPTGLPSIEAIELALTRGEVGGEAIRWSLAAACWLAWVQLLVCVLAEATAFARGTVPRRVPGTRPLRRVATFLVTSAAVAASAPAERPAPAPLALALTASHAPAPGVTPVDQIVVVPGDTLWDLAHRHLGGGVQWRALFDVNRGRPQPDGRALENPDLIRPSWRLVTAADRTVEADGSTPLPSPSPAARPAPPAAFPDPPTAPQPNPPVTNVPTSHASRPVAPMPSAPRSTSSTTVAALPERSPSEVPLESIPAPEDLLPDEPELVGPASTPVPFRLPAAETWPDTAEPDPPADGGPAGASPPEEADLSDAERMSASPAKPDHPVRTFGPLPLLAAGTVWSLDRARRRSEQWRGTGRRTRPRTGGAIAVEGALRTAADAAALTALDIALRRVGTGSHVVAATVGDDEVTVLTSDRCTGDLLWPVTRFVRTDLTAVPDEPHGAPAMVTLGRVGDRTMLVNLAAASFLAIEGGEPGARETLLAFGVDLATGPGASRVRVVLVRFGAELAVLPGIELATAVGSVIAAHRAAPAARRPEVTVMIAPSVTRREAEELRAWVDAGGGRAAAVVSGRDLGARWTVRIDGQRGHVEPLGVDVEIAAVAPALVVPTADLFRPAEIAGARAAGVASRSVEPRPLEVRVLGDVGVDGAAEAFRRRKALELVVYLAYHRRGATAEALAEALWPGRAVEASTLHSTISLARRALGATRSGEPVLPSSGPDGLYRLSPEVGLDHDRFLAHVARAAADTDAVAVAVAELRAALTLVRSRPFTVVGPEYVWLHSEALASGVAADIADASHQLADLCLAAGDARGAWWATQQGLLASPYNEQLHRDRMLAADLAGDPEGVEQVMREVCRALEIDLADAEDALHPMTIATYARLRRKIGRSATR